MTIEERRARDRARYYARKTPEFMEKSRIRNNLRYHKQRDADPEELKRYRHARYLKDMQTRLLHDPEYRANILKRFKDRHAMNQQDERYRAIQCLKQWLFSHAWV